MKVPAHSLITIPPSWPFSCWELDMIGPLTKWIEYKPVTTPSADRVVDFICDILYHLGFPDTIITDLGSNFTADSFWEFCERSAIDIKYVSVANPRANGQAEHTNGLILEGLKKRLYEANSKKEGKWIFEVPRVIWGLQTQPCKLTGSHYSFLCMVQKPSSRQTSCGNQPEWRCTKKAKQRKQEGWNSTSLKKNYAMT